MTVQREWFSAAELAAMRLPGVPASKHGVFLLADRLGWTALAKADVHCRPRKGRGGGVEFHYMALPDIARAEFLRRFDHQEYIGEPAEIVARFVQLVLREGGIQYLRGAAEMLGMSIVPKTFEAPDAG